MPVLEGLGVVEGDHPGENMIITGNNIYNIEKSGVFVFAAQAIQVSGNILTGIDCSESIYCFFTSNTIRNCQTAFHYYSVDEKFATMKNVTTNNMLINCKTPEIVGPGIKENTSVNNHIINN